MDSRSLAILLPSAYRPHALARCLASLLESKPFMDMRIVVSLIDDDDESKRLLVDIPCEVVVRSTDEYQRGAVYGWNKCLRYAPGFDLYVLAADDLVFQPGWLMHALSDLDALGGHGLIGLNDMSSDGEVYAAHWLADRQFLIEHNGGVMYPPIYCSWWADREVTDIAQQAGCYRWARAALAEHFNYSFGKSEVDRTYREAMANYDCDRNLYYGRKANRFPKTWKPIIT